MIGQPPGTIIQLMFIERRLKKLKKNYFTFLEIGAGNGILSHELLKIGFDGVGVDLNESACKNNSILNASYINTGKYEVVNIDANSLQNRKFDFIISAMVIEHLEDNDLKALIAKCRELLNPYGRLIFLVPGSMKYWGIEDEIAGHVKRYEFANVHPLADKNGLKVAHMAGLTYPLSNFLFRLSNYLVKKEESDKLMLSQKEKTIYTGNRNVQFKTTFPKILNLVLNPYVMYPFYLLQKFNLKNTNSMVLYFELINK